MTLSTSRHDTLYQAVERMGQKSKTGFLEGPANATIELAQWL
ncbi:hypothetical protein [uncultured Shewanella sp.]|nr:hypothetical protein [uncultured Shewanella sp.]